MPLKVIGTGFGRTGTLSLKLALEQLGFGPCYHMIETRRHPEHDALWLAIARGESNDWRTILAGYAACVDWPTISIWQELIAANPQAKIILTVRDPEAWYASADETIFARMQDFADALANGDADAIDPARQKHMTMVNTTVVDNTFGGRLDKAHAIAVFNAHNEEVRRSVPPERLLVYESGEGWERLCKFLGVPLPQAPYPKLNSTEDFATQFPQRT
ncbi:MAG TPA: sulfotransferase [Methyloceanibacter sp.]|nr:sulfotransferase [Methyloceanibacter sp.]